MLPNEVFFMVLKKCIDFFRYSRHNHQQKHYYLRAKFKFIVDHEVLPDSTSLKLYTYNFY